MRDILELTLSQMLKALQHGDFSSRELTCTFLERIERLDGGIRAFLTLTPELALSQADEADNRLAAWRVRTLRSAPSSAEPVAT